MNKPAKRIAIFPGTFDPFTKGHEDIAVRGGELFDHLVIAFGNNSKKHRYFEIQAVMTEVENIFRDNPKISVQPFTGLTAEFAKSIGADFILRGLRNTTDFEYENTIAQANSKLYPKLETVFLITSPLYTFISSTIIREIHKYGGDLDNYMPYTLKGLPLDSYSD